MITLLFQDHRAYSLRVSECKHRSSLAIPYITTDPVSAKFCDGASGHTSGSNEGMPRDRLVPTRVLHGPEGDRWPH